MAWGTNRGSRVKICISLLFASLVVMILPMVFAYSEIGLRNQGVLSDEEPYNLSVALLAYSPLFVVGIVGAATFLGVLVAQLVTIDANAAGTAKLMGLELPFEIRGATVLLLILYLLLVVFFQAIDLREQWTVKSLQRQIILLEKDLERERTILSAIKTIHDGPHIDEIPMLRLSYHCGGNAITESITEWSRLDPVTRFADQKPREPIPNAFSVRTRHEFIYRVKFSADALQDFNNSPIRVRAVLDPDGALRAQIHMAHPDAYSELWSFCKGEEIFVRDDGQILIDNLDPTAQGTRP